MTVVRKSRVKKQRPRRSVPARPKRTQRSMVAAEVPSPAQVVETRQQRVAPSADVKIRPAKGRPMLTWVGKRPLSHVTAFPAQHVETFQADADSATPVPDPDVWRDWPEMYPKGGLLLHGDSKEILAHLLANGFRGKVQLIYIDPPFDSGADYVRKVTLRGPAGTAKITGETYTLGEQIQYTDIWANDNYLQFIYERLLILKELLAPTGSLYLHCDPRRSHQLRMLLDEVLGEAGFVSEIVWQSADAQSSAKRYGPIHNTILYYAKGEDRIWNDVRSPLSKSTADNWYTNEEVADTDLVNKIGVRIPKGTVRRFNKSDLTARKPGGDTEYEWKGLRPPPGRYWAYSRSNMEEFERQGALVYAESGRPYLKRYLDEVRGVAPQDLWTDISMLRGITDIDDTGYPTEKPEPLLERIVRISSNTNDLVLDCFIGSGTTAAVSQRLGRRWIGCDINKGAIQTTDKRLQAVIREQVSQIKDSRAQATQQTLLEDEPQVEHPTPSQSAFTVWRVNDYDLQIQHNEAVNLACEHIGVVRTRTDSYFDGTLGKSLVKIVPFDHPLSPLDLEEVKRELQARPEEDRSVTMVCLGIEPSAQPWIEDWNRLRKGKNAINRIEVIELRTDPKYGQFIRHQPASARVKIERRHDKLHVVIENFISPSVIERLQQQAGVLSPRIEDWRAMVDSVMIDPAYDGVVFKIALADVPERKSDFVQGSYELSAPQSETTIAVKITDMLGEEVLITRTV